MLIGSFHHTLEAKGRLAIPKSFRKDLGDQPILTVGLETCLQLLPFNTWRKLTQNLGSHPLEGQTQRDLRRIIANQAVEVTFDAQGRILIPDYLSVTVNLDKKVVVAGSIDWVEIWDRETYVIYLNQLNTNRIKLSNQFSLNNHHE